MASLTWILGRSVTNPAIVVTAALAGLTSGLLVWTTHRSSERVQRKMFRIDRRVATVAGALSALRDESECRWEMQRIWATDKDQANSLFGRRRKS